MIFKQCVLLESNLWSKSNYVFQVWPYILGHYKWSFTPEEKVQADQKVKVAYENKLSDWMAIEAIVRQRDREATAACIAKLAGILMIMIRTQ